jgi:hypothetical protein
VKVKSARRALEGIFGGDFSDPTNERIIYLCAFGLALVGVALLVGTILWWRRGRQEHPALAPLEVMSGRVWAKAPEGDRRRRLDHVRLAGSGAAMSSLLVSEPVDLEALVRSVPEDFDDLREPGSVIELPPGPEAGVAEAAIDELEEPVAIAPDPDPEPEPEAAAPDATSISMERPAEPKPEPAGSASSPPESTK